MRVHTDWLLTPERAIVHLPTATAVLADVHLGYGQARRRGGEAVPAYDWDDTVSALSGLFSRRPVRRLVIAGDLIENRAGENDLKALWTWLRGTGVELAGVVPGNHDRGWDPSGVPVYPRGFELGSWRVLHGDRKLPAGRLILGHFHPCLRWGGVAAPCFLVGERHIVLPAFSADAAGVNVLGVRRWRLYRCAVIAGTTVLDLGEAGRLRRKRKRASPRRGGV